MIISASRRTDIPAFYGKWFMNRLREGYILVRNPMNYHQVSQISLTPELVDCIVFWTKNAEPFLPYLDEISARYRFYFQYTLNSYGNDIEANVPTLQKKIDAFRRLAAKIGSERVIWRYDPVMLTPHYKISWHMEQFELIASALSGSTSACVFSFIDMYPKMKNNMKNIQAEPFTEKDMLTLAKEFSFIAKQYGFSLRTCAETVELNQFGIEHGCCIDGKLIERLTGWKLCAQKDKTQRPECGCLESIDIGQYNTCPHGCRYCYANFNPTSVSTFSGRHDPDSPLLIGHPEPEDHITLRRNMKSLKQSPIDIEQLSLF